MGRFKVGDRCKVVKNALAPRCVGMEVVVVKVIGTNGYRVKFENGRVGIAAESCLEKID